MFALFRRGNENRDSLIMGKKFIYKAESGNESRNSHVLYTWKTHGRMSTRKYTNKKVYQPSQHGVWMSNK